MGKGGSGGCPIEHIVVLMLENRSFDNICGFLKRLNPNIDGLTGNESNPIDPANPSAGSVTVSDDSTYVTSPDPDHSVPGTTFELWGQSSSSDTPPTMDGFVKQYAAMGAPNAGADVMKCFAPENVPSLSTLATSFAVFDRYFASIPGPTEPNRMYIHSATSHGAADNDDLHLLLGYPQETIYDSVYNAGHSFGIYYSDFPAALIMRTLRQKKYIPFVQQIQHFYDACKNGTLPNYSFLEPRYFKFLQWEASDMHPPHDVQLGDYLIADVYEALRNSPQWESTALIITYDEHGGLYDHVPTPVNGVPNPDGINSTNPPFDFTRLGVRVPCVLVSPWIAANTVVHDPPASDQPQPTSCYEHSSVLATAKLLFNLPSFLTQRDAWAATFLELLCGNVVDTKGRITRSLMRPRSDCPLVLPRAGSREFQQRYRQAEAIAESHASVVEAAQSFAPSEAPITDLQREMLVIANGLVDGKYDPYAVNTEHEGALFVRRCMAEFRAALAAE